MGGMTGLLLLLWAGVTVGSVVDLQKRIIGGRDCLDTERGYHVFLKMNDGTSTGNYLCSGSLIYNEWILTAGHCWKTGRTIKAVFRNSKEVTISKENIFKHEANHDIMLLKITNPTHRVTAGRLPFDCVNKPEIGDEVQIAGYYSTAQPGVTTGPNHINHSKPLQCANTTVVKCLKKCVEEGNTYKYPLENLLCYQKAGVDTTPGDSGGGVVYNGRIYGVHVRSKVIKCAGPAKAMNVCEYMDWIETTTGIPRPTQ